MQLVGRCTAVVLSTQSLYLSIYVTPFSEFFFGEEPVSYILGTACIWREAAVDIWNLMR